MRFTWDHIKASKNEDKHDGVTFEEASTVFFNGPSLTIEDRDHDELRMITMGFSTKARILVVVYTEKIDDEIHIISARKATASERKEYEKKIRLL